MERKPVVTPLDTEKLSYKDKKKALEAFNLIKDKRTRVIKGRTCADDGKQKRHLKGG